MATKIATADGNFTTGATWADVITASTSLLDAENGTTTLTTSYVESQTFTPGAVTIDGIAVHIGGRATTPTGTISIRLAQAGVLVAGTEVTINVSDIPLATALSANRGNGWIFFKFAAPVLLVAATAYTVSARTSSASQVSLYRDGTAANWSRMLRSTTTGAPGAGDNWFILGEWTAAATKTNRAVTMDQTATTDYGGGSTTLASFGIGVGGTLTWATTAATAFILRLSGVLEIYVGGTMTMGTTGTPCPRDSSMELQWDCAADGDFGWICWGTLTLQGLSRSAGLNVVQCLLNTDEAIGQTVLGVDTETGWLNGDVIGIASTTQTASQAETATLSGAAAASSITITAGIAAAHSGTSPNQAEVVLLTRNVRMTAVTTTAVWYGQVQAGAALDWDWAGFRYFGSASTKVGAAYVFGTPASFTVDFCLLRDSESDGIVFSGASAGGELVINDTIFYACPAGQTSRSGIRIETSSPASVTATRCTTIHATNTNSSYYFLSITSDACTGFVAEDCRVSSGPGGAFNVTAALGPNVPKVLRRPVCHCLGTASGGSIITINPSSGPLVGFLIEDPELRRCAITSAANGPILIGSGASVILIDGGNVIACANGMVISTAADSVWVRNVNFGGDASFNQTQGVLFAQGNSRFTNIRFENCVFGSGVAHTTADINGSSISFCLLELTLVNCQLTSATEIGSSLTTATNFYGMSFIAQHRKDGATGVHQTNFLRFGVVSLDTVTFRTAGPSQKLAPSMGVASAAMSEFRFRSGRKRIAVASGKKITVSVYVQKDGSYNGAQPRLVLLANPAIGIDDDTVLDTLSVGSGSWQQLSGQMAANAEETGYVEAVVECDGSAGAVYVDDWSKAST